MMLRPGLPTTSPMIRIFTSSRLHHYRDGNGISPQRAQGRTFSRARQQRHQRTGTRRGPATDGNEARAGYGRERGCGPATDGNETRAATDGNEMRALTDGNVARMGWRTGTGTGGAHLPCRRVHRSAEPSRQVQDRDRVVLRILHRAGLLPASCREGRQQAGPSRRRFSMAQPLVAPDPAVRLHLPVPSGARPQAFPFPSVAAPDVAPGLRAPGRVPRRGRVPAPGCLDRVRAGGWARCATSSIARASRSS